MSKLYIRLPTLGVLCQEDKPLEHLAWKTTGLSFRTARGLEKIETSLLKGAHKSSHVSGPKEEAIIWDELGSALPVDLGKASQGGRRQLELTKETQTLAASILGRLFYHKDTGTGKYHFGILLAYSHLDLPACWHQYSDNSGQAAGQVVTQPYPPTGGLP